MNVRKAAVFLLVLLLLPALVAAAETVVPLKLLSVAGPEGEAGGELLLMQRLESADSPSATIAIVTTQEGHRGELTFVFDPGEGSSTQRFVDLSTGWWAELEHDFGFSNLGTVEDYGNSSDWLEANYDRLRQERAPSTFRLTTSEGSVEWIEPWEEPEEAERNQRAALAELASDVVASEPPASALAELAVLAVMIRADQDRDLSSFETLAEALALAVRAAEIAPASSGEGRPRLVTTAPSERADEVSEVVADYRARSSQEEPDGS